MRQIDPLIDPVPDQVFAEIGNVRPRAIGGGRRAIDVRSTSLRREPESNPPPRCSPDWK
jgi:hypothetical protein